MELEAASSKNTPCSLLLHPETRRVSALRDSVHTNTSPGGGGLAGTPAAPLPAGVEKKMAPCFNGAREAAERPLLPRRSDELQPTDIRWLLLRRTFRPPPPLPPPPTWPRVSLGTPPPPPTTTLAVGEYGEGPSTCPPAAPVLWSPHCKPVPVQTTVTDVGFPVFLYKCILTVTLWMM